MTRRAQPTPQPTPFHAGELAAQDLAGVRADAEHVRPIITDTLSGAAAQFLAAQPMVVLGAADAAGRMWASLLSGPAGFLRATGPTALEVHARPADADPLADALRTEGPIGALAIDLARRRRIRINGRRHPQPDGIRIDVQQAYPNCPKYIQRRTTTAAAPTRAAATIRSVGNDLSAEQRALISRADTFFIATQAATGDSDVSHRGGDPGFVQALTPTHLRWPDYPGNAMLMTLGNLTQDAAAGLLIPDFTTGRALHLSGTATVTWNPDPADRARGAQRVLDFHVSRVVDLDHALAVTFSTPEPSPFNPPSGNTTTERHDS